jgi:serine/threonine-protein kinase
VWSFTTGDYVFSSPAVVNGTVYVGSYDNNVYAIGNAAGATGHGTTPGFEVMLALVGLVIGAYVVRRKS